MKHTLAVATGLALAGLVGTAAAHFRLDSPPSVTVLSSGGDPQKTAPCGGAGTPSSKVTAVRSGANLSITIEETIFHAGHYRVAVAQDEAGLPAAPMVTPNMMCKGLTPQTNPSLPVLADGLLAHTSPFSGPQTMQVPIPAGMTCTGCVLQVLEYMSNHLEPCFYYHCAKVDISPDAPLPPDGGIPGDDAGEPGSGCCSASPRSAATSLLGALVVGLTLGLRRRRPRR